ncbi:MAG: hypothetical protein AAGF97_13435 [Planctomycetota bacterium]
MMRLRFLAAGCLLLGGLAQPVHAQFVPGGVEMSSVKVETFAPTPAGLNPLEGGDLCGTAMFSCMSVDLDGLHSGGSTGPDAVINLDLMTGGTDVTVVGIGWSLGLDSASPSWRSEANVDFNGAVTLVPGLGDDSPGTTTYNSMGIEDLRMVDLDGDGNVDADLSFVASGGQLSLTLFESFDDPEVDPDGMYLANSTISIEYMAPINCDFDGNETCDVDDLNMMLALGPIAGGVSATGNEMFDLNGDGTIDTADRDAWLAGAASENGLASPYKLGDATLDGTVDGSDFLAWNDNKFDNSLQWNAGDFNSDGVVDGADFLAWNSNKFTSSDGVNAVPEPSLLTLLLAGVSGLAIVRRR